MKKKWEAAIVIGFFVLNILNTYFLTSSLLNRYIVAFKHTFSSEVFSILGNFVVLLFIFIIGVLIFKKPKRIIIYLISVTLVLNIMVIALGYYTKSYKLAFSIFNFSIFKNGTGGFGTSVFFDWIYELFGYYRIVSLLPFVFMLVMFLCFKKQISTEKVSLSLKKVLPVVLAMLSVQIVSYVNFSSSLKKNWKCSSDYAQYGCQYTGVYSYYFSEIVLRIDNRTLIEKSKEIEEVYSDLNMYDKNKSEYTNFIDGKTYSIKDNQTGVLKGSNIFAIQMESTMSFCFNSEFKDVEISPYMNSLFKNNNCFYFDNVYTNVGVGNTSDAEFCFFTGLYPTGDMTIVWDYADYDFQMKALGDYLPDYSKHSYNPTTEGFYNHKNVHQELYKMDEFRGVETFESIYPRENNASRYLNRWIRDNEILDWARQDDIVAHKTGRNSFSFVETITPHNPFPSFEDKFEGYEVTDFDLGLLNYQLENYLNQVRYNDKMIYDFLMDSTDPSSPNYMENTVFILYGDHGNALPKDSYDALYGRELTDFEYRQILLQIPVIVYDPSGNIYASMESQKIENILAMVKSERDLNRTIMNLLGIESTESVFGVNIFSGEPTYSYDPKNYDIITDNFMYSQKKKEYVIFDGEYNQSIVDTIVDYRTKQDLYLNTLVYTSLKKQ